MPKQLKCWKNDKRPFPNSLPAEGEMSTFQREHEKSSSTGMLLLLLAFLFLSRDGRDIGFGNSRVHFLLLVVNELKPGRGRPPDKYSSGKGMGGKWWDPRPLLSLAQLQTERQGAMLV